MPKIELNVKEMFQRKTDDRGRFNLPSSEYANKEIRVAVLDEEEDYLNYCTRCKREGGAYQDEDGDWHCKHCEDEE